MNLKRPRESVRRGGGEYARHLSVARLGAEGDCGFEGGGAKVGEGGGCVRVEEVECGPDDAPLGAGCRRGDESAGERDAKAEEWGERGWPEGALGEA